MSRYVILIILNLPLVGAGLLSSIVSYKMRRTSRDKFLLRIGLWVAILAGLIMAEPIYNFLFSNNLTQTEPLSLFDVIQITGILFILFMANRAFIKADSLERRLRDLHQQVAILLSEKNK